MADNWEKNYLTLLAELIDSLGENSGMKSIELGDDEHPTLTLIPALDGELYSDVAFRISIEHILEGTSQLRLMVSMFTGLSAELLVQTDKVIARINEFMVLGNVATFRDGGMIFFTHAFCFYPEIDTKTVTAQLGSALAIAIDSVPAIMDLLAPIIEGKITADALISEGIDLIQ